MIKYKKGVDSLQHLLGFPGTKFERFLLLRLANFMPVTIYLKGLEISTLYKEVNNEFAIQVSKIPYN